MRYRHDPRLLATLFLLIGAGAAMAQTPVPDPSQSGAPAAPVEARQGPQAGRPRPQAPPRDDASRASEPGTSRIRGRVTDDNGRPLRRAVVVSFGANLRQPRTTLTNPEGEFELTGLAAGTYRVSASKGGYVQQSFGQRSGQGPGRPLEVAAGQALDRIDFALPRGGVITGRVVDEFGEPMTDASVVALSYVSSGGRRRLMPTGRGAQTDDLGQYRLFGLAPGEYYVSGQIRSQVNVGPRGADSAPADSPGYAPTFAPGTPNAAEAMRIAVQAGQETTADIQLTAARLASVTGTVVASTGHAVTGGLLRLVPKGEASFAFPGLGGPIGEGGAFAIHQVPPGAYTLVARTGIARGGYGPGRRSPEDSDVEFALVPLVVAGDDLSGVRVVTGKGISVPGVVVAEGGSLPRDSQIRVTATPADPDDTIGGPGMREAARVQADGRFQLEELAGDVIVQPGNLPSGWMLKSVVYKGADVTDRPLEPSSDGGPLRIVLTNRMTAMIGSVAGSNGAPLADYDVVIFSADPARWRAGRSVRVLRPDQQGLFKAESLIPGQYLVAAFERLDDESRANLEVLEKIRGLAQEVTLAEGQTRTLRLALSALPR